MRKITSCEIVIIVLMIICPVLTLPIIFVEIYKGRYYATKYLAFFMALLAFLWPPTGDLYRFYQEYEIIGYLKFNEVIEFGRFDFLTQYLMYYFSKIGIKFEWYRFFLCLIEYYFVFKVTDDIIRSNNYGNGGKINFYIFISVFGLVGFASFFTGARFPLSFVLTFYGSYILYYKKKWLGLIPLLLSCFIHYSFWPVFILALICYVFNPNLTRKPVLIILVVLAILSQFLLIFLIDYINFGEMMMNQLENYTTGYFAMGETQNQSLKLRIALFISALPLYLISIWVLANYNNYNNCQLFIFLLMFLVLLFYMKTAYNRYAAIALIVILPFFLLNQDGLFSVKKLRYLYFLSWFVILISLMGVKREFKVGSQYLVTTPLPYLFQHEYTYNWINSHIEETGNIVGND